MNMREVEPRDNFPQTRGEKMIKLKKKNLQIAIDGLVGSGKSIAASELAKKLGVLYVYTGAMYRAVAWLGLQKDLDLEKEEPLVKILKKAEIKLEKPSRKGRVCDVLVNDQDVTDELFSSRIHWGSAQVGRFPHVRKHLVALQQQIAQDQAVVMEGRDITSVVLPNADFKIYMTADLEMRARRCLKDLLKKGERVTFKEVLTEIKRRDYQDTHRAVDPLKKVPGAWVLDTTNLSVEEEIAMVIDKLKEQDLVAEDD